jgi:hypothetical protein
LITVNCRLRKSLATCPARPGDEVALKTFSLMALLSSGIRRSAGTSPAEQLAATVASSCLSRTMATVTNIAAQTTSTPTMISARRRAKLMATAPRA